LLVGSSFENHHNCGDKNKLFMKSILGIFLLVFFFIFLSCNTAKQESNQTDNSDVSKVTQESEEVEESQLNMDVEGVAEQTTDKKSTDEVMLNPPHGEPNHRCDIPVGAPLDSESKTAKKETEVMLNPPHGEPNHRCDIPVGAPLNSPAGTTTQPAGATAPDLANNPMAPTVENAKRLNLQRNTSSAAPATGEKPRLNPPHGQPWHRCDIAVGSPLP
jgi:hypothetical protein